MSLLSVSMPASAPFCTALVKFCSIVARFPTASCCASATPRYPHAPQGCENARFADPSRIPNGTVPLSG
jgi:hypothetical protein